MLSTERSFASRVCLLIPKANYRTVHLEKFFSWLLVCSMSASEEIVNPFICGECWISFCVFVVSWQLASISRHLTVRLGTKICSQNVHFHHTFWRTQNFQILNCIPKTMFLSSTHIDFAVPAGALVRTLASPVFDSRTCGLSFLLVLFLTLRGFSPGTPVFPSPQKPTSPNYNSIWIIV